MNNLFRQSAISKVIGKNVFNVNQTNPFFTSAFNSFKLTGLLGAEPTKAKKRIDPAILMARENRKRKKIEKEIKKLEKFGRKLKPIEEEEPDRAIFKEVDKRKRQMSKLSQDEMNDQYFLKKEWAIFVGRQHMNQIEQLEKALKSQERALIELKKDNFDLYNKAIQLDEGLVPYLKEGPVHTPPTKTYEPPEGDYLDVTYLYDRR